MWLSFKEREFGSLKPSLHVFIAMVAPIMHYEPVFPAYVHPIRVYERLNESACASHATWMIVQCCFNPSIIVPTNVSLWSELRGEVPKEFQVAHCFRERALKQISQVLNLGMTRCTTFHNDPSFPIQSKQARIAGRQCAPKSLNRRMGTVTREIEDIINVC
jgi:hypothetical protein